MFPSYDGGGDFALVGTGDGVIPLVGVDGGVLSSVESLDFSTATRLGSF